MSDILELFGGNAITIPPESNINERGYETTFYQDFSIADKFGKDAIQDTYNRAFRDWKSNCKYLTELVIVLNHKMWDWYEKDLEFSHVYEDLYKKAATYAEQNLKGDELDYYYRKTD